MEILTVTLVNHVTLLVDVVLMLPNVLVVQMVLIYIMPNVSLPVQLDTTLMLVTVNHVTIPV